MMKSPNVDGILQVSWLDSYKRFFYILGVAIEKKFLPINKLSTKFEFVGKF